jgi:hypothetical protein
VSGRPAHHDLCFGCGLSNPFGLQLEAQREDGRDDAVVGRFFVKQDHQGPSRGAHPGVLAAALLEAVSLAGGAPASVRLELGEGPAVGTFVRVEASAEHAVARDDSTGEEVARATCPRA